MWRASSVTARVRTAGLTGGGLPGGTVGTCNFGVLGPVAAAVGGRGLPLASTKIRCLLAALLLGANQVVSVNRLVDVLWYDDPPRSAIKNLHQYVYRLRRELATRGAADRVARHPAGYLLSVEPDELDLNRFESLTTMAGQLASLGEVEPAAQRLSEALALWRDTPLADVRDAPILDNAARPIEERRLQVLEERIRLDLELGRHNWLLPELEGLVREHPLRERFREYHIVALYACGRRADALHAFQDVRVLLARELGIDPGPALRELVDAILNDDNRRLSHTILPGRGR